MAQERTKKQPKKISARYLKNSGTAYLNRFPASTPHFRDVMMRKIDRSCRAHTDQDRQACIKILDEETIPYFQDLGILNDTLYAKALAESLKRRGLPTRMIERKMTLKGVPREHITPHIREREDEDDWQALLITARKKRCGVFGGDKSAEKQRKDMGRLARAGFSYGLIERFFNSSDQDIEDLLAV